jgi:Tfp pilus assembly protein PilZ
MDLMKNCHGKYNLTYKLGNKSYLCSAGGIIIEFDSREEAEQVKKQIEIIMEKMSNSKGRD